MKPEPWTDDDLQQAFDGEPVGDADLAQVRGSEEGAQRLDKLQQLRGHLERYRESQGALAEHESDALFARIQQGIRDTEQEPSLRLVADAEDKTAPSRAVDGAPGTPPAVHQTREPWQHLIPASGFLAAAAAVLLAFVVSGRPTTQVTLTATPPPVITVASNPFGSEVVEADFGENIGTIFEVEGQAGEPIAVVWISDDMLEGQEPEETVQ